MADDTHTPLKIHATPAYKPHAASTAKTPESEPVAVHKTEIKTEPVPEKKLSPEVVEYIKQHEEKVKLPEALKEMGVVADAKDHEIEDVVEGPTLPMSDQQIADGLKQPRSMSVRWLSLFLLYLLQQSHYTLKTVKGHVKRIVKP